MGRVVGDAREWHSLGHSLGAHSRKREEGPGRSAVSVLFAVCRLCVPQFTFCPRWHGRETSGAGLRHLFPLTSLSYRGLVFASHAQEPAQRHLALRLLAAHCASPLGRRDPRARRGAASRPFMPPARPLSLPDSDRETEDQRAAQLQSPFPIRQTAGALPAEPAVPTRPGQPRAPPPRARPAVFRGRGRSPDQPRVGVRGEGVSVSQARLGTCTGWRSTGGGAPASRAHGSCRTSLPLVSGAVSLFIIRGRGAQITRQRIIITAHTDTALLMPGLLLTSRVAPPSPMRLVGLAFPLPG